MPKRLAWGGLLLILSLDSIAGWAMVWQHDLRTSLGCLVVGMGLLCTSYRLWRWGA